MAVPDRTTRTGPPEPTPMVRSDTDHVEACTHICSPVDNRGKTPRGTDDFGDDEVDGKSEGRFSVRDVASPGEYVAGGRYRLLLFHGGPEGLQFWQATDTALGRQVALTLVGPQFGSSGEYLREVLARTLRLSRLDTPGIARVLQVTRTGPSAVVASEWVRGGSLREVADTAPSSTGAARAMQSLADAAVAAHRAGLALSIDHPDRIRVSVDGDVTLAFPATLPDATPEDDVRGCGAVLYALLSKRWPLRETGTGSGLAPAELETQARPKELSTIDPDIPFEIAAAAAGSLQAHGGIRSATTLSRMLQLAAESATIEPDSRAQRSASVRLPPLTAGAWRARPRTGQVDRLLRNRRLVGIALGAAVVAVMLLVASALSHFVGNGTAGVSLATEDKLGIHPTVSPALAAPASHSATIKPVRATVFSPGGGADNPQSAGLAIDGDPGTAWTTDTYFDAAPFPGFKDGVGLVLELPHPTVLTAVTVDVDSTGTVVQIRSAPTTRPAKLADTTELTPPTPMQHGHNSIPVHTRIATSTVLVWISTLGTIDGKSRSDISEITLQAAS